MAVEDWVDEIAKLFEIADGRGGTVKSYRAFDKNEFPAALDKFPCALTYTVDSESVYSTGGPNLDYWNGITDFHLTPDLDKSKLPYVMQFFKRIRNAAASNMTLNGKVSWFQLRTTSSGGGPSIQGPVEMSYGDEAPHHGLRVYWQVKENVTADFEPTTTPAAAIFDWYVDSVTGNDNNDGLRSTTPFATIAKLLTVMAAGESVGLARGSHWREQLTLPGNNCMVVSYGSGARPILDCSDVIATGNWSKTGGYTNIYQCTKSPDLAAAETYNGIFEDDSAMILATSLENCDATPGSFYFSSNTTAPCTLYVHATSSGNPASNGKTYEYAHRQNAVNSYGYTGISITGVEGRKCLGGSGNFRIGDSSLLNDCLSTWGVKHNFYIGTGCTLIGCIAMDIREYASGQTGAMYVTNADSPNNEGGLFLRCTAQGSSYISTATGFHAHRNVSGDFGTLIYTDCTITDIGVGYSGIHADLTINNVQMTDCIYLLNYQSGAGDVTITDGAFVTSRANGRAFSLNVAGTLAVDGLTITHTNTISGATFYIAAGVVISLTISDCSITTNNGQVALRAYNTNGGSVSVSGCNFHLTGTDSTAFYTLAGGPAITSDNNCFDHNIYNYTIQGVTYTDLATYQAGTGQDTNSTIGGCAS